MKKLLSLTLVVLMLFSLVGCHSEEKEGTEPNEHHEMICEAIELLKDYWLDSYLDNEHIEDYYFEIKNTRVCGILENDVQEFSDVSYVIEFTLFTNYYCTAPYYMVTPFFNDCVIVHRNGTMEVSRNPFQLYRSRTFDNDFSSFLDEIWDYQGAYNCKETLE